MCPGPFERLVNAASADDGRTGTITISDSNRVAVLRGVSRAGGAALVARIHPAIRTQAFLRLSDGGDYSTMALRVGMARYHDTPRPIATANTPPRALGSSQVSHRTGR